MNFPEAGLAARRLRLADHVRACALDGHVVLLDLERNRYHGIGPAQSARLGRIVEGWPDAPLLAAEPAATAGLEDLLRPMLARGLLATGPSRSAAATGALDEPTTSLEPGMEADQRPGLLRACRFAAAAAFAGVRLRTSSLGAIADGVARTRARRRPADARPERLHKAVRSYEALRPLAFSARDKCLFDSLALIVFLGWEGLFPHWVIGVRTNPFGAHSWVQSGDMVLNDLHENVSRFKPILVV